MWRTRRRSLGVAIWNARRMLFYWIPVVSFCWHAIFYSHTHETLTHIIPCICRIENELCADRSALRDNDKYWADENGGCFQDYQTRSPLLDVQLFNTIEDCCAFGNAWLSQEECFAASQLQEDVSVLGSDSYYVQDDKCVKDCIGEAPCGGLAQKTDVTYATPVACCSRLPWIPREDCVSGLWLCFGSLKKPLDKLEIRCLCLAMIVTNHRRNILN